LTGYRSQRKHWYWYCKNIF